MSTITDTLLRSVVTVRATAPEDGFTAPMLGTERSGSGVVIGDKGLVLTVGYLIVEASDVALALHDGRSVPGHVLAYDQATGFGLIQALGRLDLPPVKFGDSSKVKPGDEVTLVGARAAHGAAGKVVARQEFAGPWEYLLDDAIFTAPAHPAFNGAALLDANGDLIGVGALALQAAGPQGVNEINMSIPIDLLPPILDDLVKHGGRKDGAHPWLGVHSVEQNGEVVVVNVDPRGPGAEAGFEQGDYIRDVRDQAVEGLADFYRKLWAVGPAGVEIPIRVVRAGREQWLRVRTGDRNAMLKKPTLQ